VSREVSPILGLVDYGRGNLRSVQRAIEHAGGTCLLVHTPAETEQCAALVVPGVGSFGDCALQLREAGLWDVIKDWLGADRPYLGICLGYQLLFDSSEESPGVEGLGVLAGKVVHFPRGSGLKIPHMGWNQLHIGTPSDRLMKGLGETPDFYFVHSYYPVPEDPSVVTSTCHYGLEFAASVTRGNLSAIQFHPEKSQNLGLTMLRNFISSLSSNS
jgi:glutamine amidotransferase